MSGAPSAPMRAAPLAAVLCATADELSALADAASGVQAALGDAGFMPDVQGASIERLQALDLITQRLAGLSAFLTALAPTVTPGASADAMLAAADVTVSALAARLCAQPEPVAAAGECELFGA